MGIWDRFGRTAASSRETATPPDADEQAIARYRYLLKTAPPETIEQAHAEAFAALTPEQRRKVLQRLSEEMPEAERKAVAAAGDSPGALAQAATRAEIRQPGAIERAFGGIGAGPTGAAAPGFGSMLAGSMLGSLAGTVLGGMVAQHFFGTHPEASHLFDNSTHDPRPNSDNASSDHGLRVDNDGAGMETFDDSGDFLSDFGSGDTFDV
jgi:hypothetical protein